ncbi:MAG TPA: heme exporter protein CcmD [Pyrinomonadaceae bacterium]|nr:heme exporter protein CcmD [Pyrinomonadaceae bacterium]
MNWERFFNMGGYAFYVWGSFGVALLLMAAEVFLLRRRRRRALARQSNEAQQIDVWQEHETTT